MEFFVDLLPEDARRTLRRQSHLRLFKFGAVLMAVVAVGVVANSLVHLRGARSEHDVFASTRDQASKIDEHIALGLQERAALQAELAADAILRSPVSATEVVATIASLLPEGGWLESIKVSLEESRTSKGALPARPAYQVLMNGRAPTAEAVQALAAALRKTQPFVGVSVLEQRTAARVGGGSDQQFVLRLKVNPTLTTSDEVVRNKDTAITVASGVTQ